MRNDPLNGSDPTGTEREFELAAIAARGQDGVISVAAGPGAEAARADTIVKTVIGGGLGAMAAAPLVGTGIVAALANPVVANQIAIGVGEIAAGDALGPGTLAVGTAALTARAGEIHGALDGIAQSMRTTAVAETAEGVRVVASSEKNLSSSQKAMLGANEIAASGPGHAEVTAVNTATAQGLTPTAVGASRPVCDECQKFLNDRGIKY